MALLSETQAHSAAVFLILTYLVSFTVGNISSFHKFLTFSTEFSTDYKRQKSTAFQWKSRLKVLISRSFVLHNGLWRAVSPCFYGFAY